MSMLPHMTAGEARKVPRKPVAVGYPRQFYSDCVECLSDNDVQIRHYSGQWVLVVEWINQADCEEEARQAAAWSAQHPNGEWDWQSNPQYKVRAANGDTFDANDGELNGWIFDTGQWVGPRIN
jgi:hypothetical protein